MKITRFVKSESVTLGRLDFANQHFYTVERPWLDNQTSISCIPDGIYKLKRVDSPKFGDDMWEIADVPDRTHILIHVANGPHNVEGCVGLGQTIYPDLRGVGSSRLAITEFYSLTAGLEGENIEIVTEALA